MGNWAAASKYFSMITSVNEFCEYYALLKIINSPMPFNYPHDPHTSLKRA